MTAEEIRNIAGGDRPVTAHLRKLRNSELYLWQTKMIFEIAAQLAEANQHRAGTVLQLSLLNEKLMDLMVALGADPKDSTAGDPDSGGSPLAVETGVARAPAATHAAPGDLEEKP